MDQEVKIELTQTEYSKFIKNLLDENKRNKKLPDKITFNECTVYKHEYIETIERVNKYVLKNSRYPQHIPIFSKKYR